MVTDSDGFQSSHRTASCPCGQLSLDCVGEPSRISVCHCLDCKRRSGSAFAAQARFPADQVSVTGEHRHWTKVSDEGNAADFHFCPICGTTLWYHARPHHDLYAVPIGTFADPDFPPPEYSVYESRKHAWVEIVGERVEHYD